MILPPTLQTQLIDCTIDGTPEEVCGLVAGRDGQALSIYPVENRLHSPILFEMQPEVLLEALIQIEKEGMDILAVYHSHPAGLLTPSQTDLASHVFPEASILILSCLHGAWNLAEFEPITGVQIPIIATNQR